MRVPSEAQGVRQVLEKLADVLNVPASKVSSGAQPRLPNGRMVDAIAHVGPHRFAIEWIGTGTAGRIAMAVEQLRQYSASLGGKTIPLVAVPYMSELGRRRCEDAGVAWLDLSGNARIFATGLRVLIEGKPNRFKRRGRPSSAFAPRSSRITRWLLMHPHTPMTQRELSQATGVDEGYTSRIVGKLEEEGFVARDENGAIRPRDPSTLLDAWREEYDFTKHHLIRGHIPARSGDELLCQLANSLRERDVEYAATALGAAWILTRFAAFRIVTMYLRESPSAPLFVTLSFREDPRGANVWLAVPNDEGVFHGASEHDGVVCVHPVQVYVDLKDHPERSDEAAARLRAEVLSRRSDG